MNYEKKYIDIIKNIVLSHINASDHFVFLFGSRAKGSKHRSADVDVGILGKKPIGKIYYKIVDELEESIVPYKVDIIDFSLVNEKFRKKAMEKIEVWNQTAH